MLLFIIKAFQAGAVKLIPGELLDAALPAIDWPRAGTL